MRRNATTIFSRKIVVKRIEGEDARETVKKERGQTGSGEDTKPQELEGFRQKRRMEMEKGRGRVEKRERERGLKDVKRQCDAKGDPKKV